jgi:hypothetical protein
MDEALELSSELHDAIVAHPRLPTGSLALLETTNCLEQLGLC